MVPQAARPLGGWLAVDDDKYDGFRDARLRCVWTCGCVDARMRGDMEMHQVEGWSQSERGV